MPSSPAVAALRSALPPSVAATLTSGAELTRLRRGPDSCRGDGSEARDGEALPTALPLVDQRLGGGLPRGGLVELDGPVSSGRFSIVLSTLASATGAGESAALVDLGDHLDPQGAAAMGVDLPRLLWVRPRTTRQALAATEIVLGAGFPLVVLDLGLALRGKRPNDAAWIRLARAAATHRAVLLVSSPYRVTGVAACGVLRAGRGRPVGLLTAAFAPYGRLLLGLELDLPREGALRMAARPERHERRNSQAWNESPPLLHALEIPRGLPAQSPQRRSPGISLLSSTGARRLPHHTASPVDVVPPRPQPVPSWRSVPVSILPSLAGTITATATATPASAPLHPGFDGA